MADLKPAIPVAYNPEPELDLTADYTNVFGWVALVAAEGPPTQFRICNHQDVLLDNRHICIQLENLVNTAAHEIDPKVPLESMNLLIQIPDAKLLCSKLIQTLAYSGDAEFTALNTARSHPIRQIKSEKQIATCYASKVNGFFNRLSCMWYSNPIPVRKLSFDTYQFVITAHQDEFRRQLEKLKQTALDLNLLIRIANDGFSPKIFAGFTEWEEILAPVLAPEEVPT